MINKCLVVDKNDLIDLIEKLNSNEINYLDLEKFKFSYLHSLQYMV